MRKSAVIAQHDSVEFFDEHYQVLKKLGSGAFGSVSLVRDLTFGQERVKKVVSTKGMAKPVLAAMKKEIELLKSLDHPSIVRLYEHAEDLEAEQLTLILEYIPGGDCWDLLRKPGEPLSEPLVARLIYQLLTALAYCGLRGVVHRDIKPLNMMVLSPPDGSDPDCKLIDFGLSERGAAEMRDYVGSPKYMAPEVHRRQSYTAKADIWSTGISTLELFVGEVTFPRPFEKTIGACKGFKALESNFAKKKGWEIRSAEAKSFVQSLLQVDPALRPSADQALELPWLEQNRPPPRKLPREVAASLSSFANAPSVVRCCLLSIAARVGSKKVHSIGHDFLGADTDGDGLISYDDLEEALDNMDEAKWWCEPEREADDVDVAEVMRRTDLDHHGGLNFTEFIAACMFADYRKGEDFAKLAFDAFDSDRDGLISVQEIQDLFRERDRPFLSTLPQSRPFGLDEWRVCVEDCDISTDASSSEDDSLPPPRGLLGFLNCVG